MHGLGVIMQDGINAFDFMHGLQANERISPTARSHGFDIIVMYGVNFGVFSPSDGTMDCCDHPVALEQYGQRHKLGRHKSQAGVFHEAVLGQDPYSTIINIHAENHSRYYLSAASMTYLRLGLFNPSRMKMRCGRDNKNSDLPLASTLTSSALHKAMHYMKINRSEEEQLDLNRLILDTLGAGGHVLVLGAGRLEICRELMKYVDVGEYKAMSGGGMLRSTSLTKLGLRSKLINGRKVTYWSHCLHDDVVNFEHVMDWTLNDRFSWCHAGVCPSRPSALAPTPDSPTPAHRPSASDASPTDPRQTFQ